MPGLRVTEIFRSLQGESTFAGRPCAFVRLTGCSLRCAWCDTAYAFHGGREMSRGEIHAELDRLGTDLVEITGGEPLEQDEAFVLIAELLDRGREVLVETGGHVPIGRVDPRAVVVLDVKAPGSRMAHRNLEANVDALRPADEIKFVLADRADFDWSLAFLDRHGNPERRRTVTFSPVWDRLPPQDLAQWILESGRPLRLGLQLHKLLWGDVPGR